MGIVLILLIAAYILVQIWLITGFYNYKNSINPEPEIWPEISILVAARDEETHIAACLDSLVQLDYPKEKLLILVGNDQSTDNTGVIAERYSKNHACIKVINIVDDDSGLMAKARVMAQLDKHAIGDFYLVTDADVTVKPGWAKYLIRHMKPGTGVASGTTMVKGNSLTAKLQEIDWAYFMGMLNMISYSGVPATAVGNNMIVRSKAYWETGGYGTIRFSITEDYKLYSEVCKKGWKWDNIMIPEVLAYSDATYGFKQLLHQRKRWLTGGKALPVYWWFLFIIFAGFYFFIPVLFCIHPTIAAALFATKSVLQYFSVRQIFKLLGEQAPSSIEMAMYEIYLFILTISTALFFILPVKTNWKNRRY